MQRFPRRWALLEKVNFLQRKIIINSIAYYVLDSSVLTDREYDELSRQLVYLQKELDIKDTQYGYIFDKFDGSTGFDLYDNLNDHDKEYLLKIAKIGLGANKRQKIKKIKKKGRLI